MIPLRDNKASHHFPIYTFALILINILVFAIEASVPDTAGFIAQYGLIPAEVD